MSGGGPRMAGGILDAAVELMARSGRTGTVRVQGTSMVPTFVAGQQLAVEFTPQRLARGDLLLFRQADYLAVHRLLGWARFPDGRPCLRARGDALPRLDPRVLERDVVGRVLAIEAPRGWRDVRTAPARVYGFAVSQHDLVWAGLFFWAGKLDRWLERRGLNLRTSGLVEATDRALLRAVHTLLFRVCHRRRPASWIPVATGESARPAGEREAQR